VAVKVYEAVASQIARNLTDVMDGLFAGKRYLIHDRDPLYTTEFLSILADVGIQSVKLPPRSPNLNAYAERFVRTIKEGCLERMIFFGEDSLRNAIREFVVHYHFERNHQGLDNRLIISSNPTLTKTEAVQTRRRLGGTLLPRGSMNPVFRRYAYLLEELDRWLLARCLI
jgi:transposase InsO family protein